MAEDKVNTPAIVEKQPKAWRYVGPGSDERKGEPIPLISNLPLDLKQPRLGISATKYPANELPAHYIPYVMQTSKEAKDWWK